MKTFIADRAAAGRNSFRVHSDERGMMITKHLQGEQWDIARRLDNSLAWEQISPEVRGVASPRFISHDNDTITHEYVLGGVSLQEKIDEAQSPYDVLDALDRAANTLGHLHSFSVSRAEEVLGRAQRDEKDIPNRGLLDRLEGLTVDEYASASGGELQCWSLFHHDSLLQEAMRAWAGTTHARTTLVHGDLRPDQFLLTGEECWLVDWEEFTLGSAMRDLAGLLGALVFQAMFATFSSPVNSTDVAEIHYALIASGQERLEALRPIVRRVLDSYVRAGGQVEDIVELARWTSWYLVERVIARSVLAVDLSATDKAVAGVGRQGIIDPSSMLQALEVA